MLSTGQSVCVAGRNAEKNTVEPKLVACKTTSPVGLVSGDSVAMVTEGVDPVSDLAEGKLSTNEQSGKGSMLALQLLATYLEDLKLV